MEILMLDGRAKAGHTAPPSAALNLRRKRRLIRSCVLSVSVT